MSLPFYIRAALPSDAAGLARVQVDSWRVHFRGLLADTHLDNATYADQEQDWIAILSGDDGIIYVALDQAGQLVAYARAIRHGGQAPADSELISIHMRPELKRQGIGRRLFLQCAEHLRAEGARSHMLWCLTGNSNARAFYDALGGTLIDAQEIEIAGQAAHEVLYIWPQIDELIAALSSH